MFFVMDVIKKAKFCILLHVYSWLASLDMTGFVFN